MAVQISADRSFALCFESSDSLICVIRMLHVASHTSFSGHGPPVTGSVPLIISYGQTGNLGCLEIQRCQTHNDKGFQAILADGTA